MKLASILNRLSQIATRSLMGHQHGAVVVKNGTPITWATNAIKGNRTYHAEHEALRRYLDGYGIPYREKGFYILHP